jgi:gamma-glutamyltranspeptidase/glutathione hydrolase
MVATADAHATAAGVTVLQEGGSVIDAAVAAAFVLCVTQPGMCGLGGGGHLVVRLADGTALCLDFRELAPLNSSRDTFEGRPREASVAGWLAAATPGTVKGLAQAHRRAGRLPWARLFARAIELANEGYQVSYLRARMLAGSGVLPLDPESFRVLLRNGRYFEPGEILQQPELARTLERLSQHGGDEFYHGKTADLLARASAAYGASITKRDLENYTCGERRPLMGSYRGREIWTMPPSSAGGIGLLQILAILEGTPFAEDGPLSSSFLHWLAEAMRRAFAERAKAVGDPAFIPVPGQLLDSRHIAHLRDSIDAGRATPSAELAAGAAVREPACTTHVSVLDRDGNAAALTFTLNGRYGSGVTVPGLGFLLNNNMDNFAVRLGKPNHYGVVQGEANAIAPGKRPVSSMAPAIVFRGGIPEIVLGTPGGPTIVTALAQALLYMLEFDCNVRDAVDAPRIHHQWLPDVLYLERGFSSDVTRALERRGHRLRYKASLTDMNAIIRRGEWLEGAADCRREGTAAGI